MAARGKLKERLWRLSDGQMATIDDISVFVVPLLPYREEHLLWKVSGGTSDESGRAGKRTSEACLKVIFYK